MRTKDRDILHFVEDVQHMHDWPQVGMLLSLLRIVRTRANKGC